MEIADQVRLVHVTREGRSDLWYVTDKAGNIITPVCSSKDQLRAALGLICLALDTRAIEVRQ